MPIPTFTSPSTGTVPVLSKHTSEIFDVLSPTEQRAFFTLLEAFRAEIDAKGDDVEYLREIGAVNPGATVAQTKTNVLDMCNWQLATCLRYSTPTRIAEATPCLEKVIAHFDSHHTNGEVDVTPVLYLGVALGQEEAAVRHFQAAYAHAPAIEMQYHTQLWSRACFSRLLRRMGRIAEAEEQENDIRNWLLGHPYGMPPSTFCALVTDPMHEGKDYILDHPSVKRMFAGMSEIAPGFVVHFG
ncbi:hypothetical protein B0H17DRAFT_1044558 [Mycena rosella]|uniref:Uncharacterized protein n=1 Tax=Mycena rosella TaxID=1033263 RepID=A0AAD7DZL2_MYCRO|nr:hypothetical protein B0H17DRAFT_1044558 [Mycena rosella]